MEKVRKWTSGKAWKRKNEKKKEWKMKEWAINVRRIKQGGRADCEKKKEKRM